MADHNCLSGLLSECPVCIEDMAHNSARMRGDSHWKNYMGEAKLLLEGIEQYHHYSSEPKP